MSERLQKYLARSGVASRRHAEELITAGKVQVNNRTVTELGTKVTAGTDLVTLDGKLVAPPEESSYFLLYKPPGVVTTMEDPQGRPTVRHYLAEVPQRLFPVGRLDYDAEGALLLTDDGELAHKLLHPSFQVPRRYLAKVRGEPDQATLDKLRGGVRLEDGVATPKSVEIFERAEKNTWLELVVSEGRQHLIKRLCAAVGHPVVRLYRPSYAGVSVQGLRPGELRPLTPEQIRRLREVAAGQAEPHESELRLPPRRHGHGAPGLEENEEVEEVEAPRRAQAPRPRAPAGPRDGGFQPPRWKGKAGEAPVGPGGTGLPRGEERGGFGARGGPRRDARPGLGGRGGARPFRPGGRAPRDEGRAGARPFSPGGRLPRGEGRGGARPFGAGSRAPRGEERGGARPFSPGGRVARGEGRGGARPFGAGSRVPRGEERGGARSFSPGGRVARGEGRSGARSLGAGDRAPRGEERAGFAGRGAPRGASRPGFGGGRGGPRGESRPGFGGGPGGPRAGSRTGARPSRPGSGRPGAGAAQGDRRSAGKFGLLPAGSGRPGRRTPGGWNRPGDRGGRPGPGKPRGGPRR